MVLVLYYKESYPNSTGITSAEFLALIALRAEMTAAFPAGASAEDFDSIEAGYAKSALAVTPRAARFNFFGEQRASESPLDGVAGLVFFSFPLHLAGKPDTKRADHLTGVSVPMLFLSGTRDELADVILLKPVVQKLRATVHLLDTADHGYKVLKKSRTSSEDVFVEMARVVRGCATRLTSGKE